jgi:hypothetical protein
LAPAKLDPKPEADFHSFLGALLFPVYIKLSASDPNRTGGEFGVRIREAAFGVRFAGHIKAVSRHRTT